MCFSPKTSSTHNQLKLLSGEVKFLGRFNRSRVQMVMSQKSLTWTNKRFFLFHLLDYQCDHQVDSNFRIYFALQQLTYLHHSPVRQMNKVDEEIIWGDSPEWKLEFTANTCSVNFFCQMFSALKCNIVNLPHQSNHSCQRIHISWSRNQTFSLILLRWY